MLSTIAITNAIMRPMLCVEEKYTKFHLMVKMKD